MGVNFKELVIKKEIEIADLKTRTIGIDSYNFLHQFLAIIRSRDGQPLMDSKGNVTSHLTGLLYRTVNLMEAGIKPVFVFDGKPHELKAKTLHERNRIRTEAKEKMEKAIKEGDVESVRKYGQRAIKLTKEMAEEAKQLIEYMGLPYVQAPSEGEAQLAWMTSQGRIYATASQDYDSLLFGASVMVRNLSVTGKRKLPNRNVYIDVKPEIIQLKEMLNHLQITREKLVWLAILVGTDFNEKFPNIGPKKALALVRECTSFEEIISKTKYAPNFNYEEIENIFLQPEHTSEFELKWKEPDTERMLDFLCTQHDFSEERVKSALAKISAKAQEKGAQSTLSKWG